MKDLKSVAEAYVKMKMGDVVNESSNDYKYKAIMYSDTRRDTTLKFVFSEEEKPAHGDYEKVSWKEWKASDKKDVSSERMKNGVIAALFNDVSQMNKKVELNSILQRLDTFEEKVDAIIKFTNRRIDKRGIRTTVDIFR